jgi:hypothetical protein
MGSVTNGFKNVVSFHECIILSDKRVKTEHPFQHLAGKGALFMGKIDWNYLFYLM